MANVPDRSSDPRRGFANEDPRMTQMKNKIAISEVNKSKTRPVAIKGTEKVIKQVVASRTAKTPEEKNIADYNAIKNLRNMRLSGAAINLSYGRLEKKISKRVAQSKKARGM